MKRLLFSFLLLSATLNVFSQNQTGDYRSRNSGNWSTISNWERYNGSSWQAATKYPTASDGRITISTTNTITYNITDKIDQVIVAEDATLIAASNNFDVADGPGLDLSIYGTLQWNKGWTGGCASWEVFETGTANMNFKTQGSSCNNWHIRPGGVMNFLDVNGYLNAVNITNGGTINFKAPGETGRVRANNIAGKSTSIQNLSTGTINVVDNPFEFGSSSNTDDMRIITEGTFNLNNAFHYRGKTAFSHSGTMNFENGQMFLVHTSTEANGGTFSGWGIMRVKGTWISLAEQTTFESNVRFIVDGGRLAGHGELSVYSFLCEGENVRFENLAGDSRPVRLYTQNYGNGVISGNTTVTAVNTKVTTEGFFDFNTGSKLVMIRSEWHATSQTNFHGSGNTIITCDSLPSSFTSRGYLFFTNGEVNFNSGTAPLTVDLSYATIQGDGRIRSTVPILNTGLSYNVMGLTYSAPSNPFSNTTTLNVLYPWPSVFTSENNIVLDGTINLDDPDNMVPEGETVIIRSLNGPITGNFDSIILPSNGRIEVRDSVVVYIKHSKLAFRSVASGNWNDLATWETFSTDTWIPAKRLPDAKDSIVFITNHTVDVNSPVVSPALMVSAAGRLNISDALTLSGRSNHSHGAVHLSNNGSLRYIMNSHTEYLINHGSFTWTGGKLFTTIVNYGTSTFSGADPKTIYSVFYNRGTLNVNQTTYHIGNPSGYINSLGSNAQVTYVGSRITGTYVSSMRNLDGAKLTLIGSNTLHGLENSGIISGLGTTRITNFVNTGTIAPGIPTIFGVSVPGTLQLLTQNTTPGNFDLLMEIPATGLNTFLGDQYATNHSLDLSTVNLKVRTIARGGNAPDTLIRLSSGLISGNFVSPQIPLGYKLRKGNDFVVLESLLPDLIISGTLGSLLNNGKEVSGNPFIPSITKRYQVFRIQGLQNTSLSIYDRNGSQVFNDNNYGNNRSLSKLAPGLYFYRVVSREGKIYSGKVVVTD